MSCTAVQNLISQYIDGRLSGAEADVVREHVQECDDCAQDFKDSQFLSRLLKENLEFPEPPKDLPRSVIRTVERTKPEK
ncbi:MAG: zf-HC2 domain-containing protein [Candidatus Wallbacteria bacterium]|nr:zf-HC2 domain-containing protein [Candidatus Wallbacteria bacterium]